MVKESSNSVSLDQASRKSKKNYPSPMLEAYLYDASTNVVDRLVRAANDLPSEPHDGTSTPSGNNNGRDVEKKNKKQ